MTVGLPGAGIGGLFYILSAIAMPVRELLRVIRHRATGSAESRTAGESAARRRAALLQSAIAFGIAGAIWVTGLALGRLLLSFGGRGEDGITAVGSFQRVLPASALVLTFGSLAVVLFVAEVARLVTGPRVLAAPLQPHVAMASIAAHSRASLRDAVFVPSAATDVPEVGTEGAG